MLSLITFLVLGTVIGGFFSNFTEGRGLNLGGSVIVGVIGSFVAGILASVIIDREIGGYSTFVILSSCAGAVLLLIFVQLVRK